jgi:hypothetical protein
MIQAPGPSAAPNAADPRLDQLQRALQAALPSAAIPGVGAGAGMPLELSTPTEPPVLARAEVVEDAELTVHVPAPAAEPPFSAFLDGTQRSELVGYVGDGVPVVRGVVAAAVREWRDGSVSTWAHTRLHQLYAPRAAIGDEAWAAIASLGVSVVDTSADAGELAEAHPTAQRDAALKQVRGDRETLELRLGHLWCAERPEMLYVDGGLRGSEAMARAAQAVGVIKSHQTLYGDRAARRVIFELAEGERTSVFVVGSSRRLPVSVASWYLRLRGAGGDPLWGLVRVEVSHDPGASPAEIGARADAVSRRVLAERMPTAHPDSRWHSMVYGIRDCEVFLKATQ